MVVYSPIFGKSMGNKGKEERPKFEMNAKMGIPALNFKPKIRA
ncbi:hypothetical protein SAMN05444008_107137 [Cnuella takakiae]|uniref:Uncharacterized protein n=1 Tax=Cnuella takakiae TaxID=1302690 RepID=A0A1M5B4F2_9BACT|nr:hypothetical protein SAMN05444008_107137 [Cnuella takakiae]